MVFTVLDSFHNLHKFRTILKTYTSWDIGNNFKKYTIQLRVYVVLKRKQRKPVFFIYFLTPANLSTFNEGKNVTFLFYAFLNDAVGLTDAFS